MSELVATIRLVRDEVGNYGVEIDLGGHGEMRGEFRTVGTALAVSENIIVSELRRRPTEPELPPVAFVP